jgi:hypothetical protein
MYVPFVDLNIGGDKDFVLIVQGLLDSQAPFMYSQPTVDDLGQDPDARSRPQPIEGPKRRGARSLERAPSPVAPEHRVATVRLAEAPRPALERGGRIGLPVPVHP